MNFKIRHFGFYVKNIKRMIKFYKKLGFKVIYENVEDWKEDFGKLKIAKLKCCNTIIEFIEKKSTCQSNFHIAIQVKSIKKICPVLEKEGFIIFAGPRLSPDKSVNIVFGNDIEENTLEIVEVL